MKKVYFLFTCIIVPLIAVSCASALTKVRDRQLSLSGYSVSELDFGGVERWYAVDKYNYDSFIDEVRFQVGYFKNADIGFVLYGDGTTGEQAYFSRQGLDLRWNWGNRVRDGIEKYRYAFVIEPDGTGLYYDFSTSEDGTAKPRGIYRVYKF